ncbi:hypothetical protein OCAE111667_05345 [Occultella aeris]|uniref:t-SNARE coiled-coil homology domain-containing protein n=2 Tax=Occultella aeris TaxID=2761496 RepID=A0A7M4DM44_9MICO|nr:hypothetical protein HALOF300_03212 [Occultella aeris]
MPLVRQPDDAYRRFMPKTPAELERKVDQLDNDVHEIYSMLTAVTEHQLAHDARFDSIDGRLDGHNTRLDSIGEKLDTVITMLGGEPRG